MVGILITCAITALASGMALNAVWTNEVFRKVGERAKKGGILVAGIAAASNEQSRSIDQIKRAINEMDRVVQKNAAGAEESSAAAEEMYVRSETMKDQVRELASVIGGKGRSL